jgi:formamidopyrimidine-DNA glycosylase
MPELPEVEVTRLRIESVLVGRRIARVETTGESYLFITSPKQLRERLPGRTVASLRRLGKYLVARLDDERQLVLHLGMTGQLFSSTASSPRLLSATARAALSPEQQLEFTPDPHTHLRIHFADGGPSVYLRDVRKFGKLMLLEPAEAHPRLARLGPDALAVDGATIFALTRKRNTSIKALLLDQSSIAGIGNIYADEALFAAGVRPTRRAARVTRAECDRLATGLVRIMRRSIAAGGSTISDYVAPDGSDGRYQDERRVYAREGEPCLSCHATVKRRVVAQRSSHYCPRCQR